VNAEPARARAAREVERRREGAPAGAPFPPIDLRPLFAPRSIAVVGASARGGIAQTVRANLAVLGSTTRCHFVNPRYDELDGQPCYPSIAALPEVPDTVVVAVNPLRAASVVADAGAAGVPSVIVPGGGVVEGGEAAARMQREVAELAVHHGIALLGPNCMGLVDLTTNSATYIGDVNPWLPRGGVAGIAQSGSVTDAFIHSGNRIGFSRIVGCGSEVVLDVCDFLAYSLDDAETDAVILFVEGFKRPERFLALADHALAIGKPVMAVKVGRSRQAQAAAIAHSGSLAGEARATDAALDAARRLLALGKLQSASDVLLDYIAHGFTDREAQRLLIEVDCALNRRDVAKEKCDLLSRAYRLDGRADVADDVERLARIL